MTATVTKAMSAIKAVQEAESCDKTRITRRIEIGHCIHQGDVYVHRVDESHKRGGRIGGDNHQIALGTGNGARHMAVGDIEVFAGMRLPEWVSAPADIQPGEITGPVIVAAKAFRIEHPEHAHHQLPAGTYQVTYQYDPRTMRRVID